MKNKIPAEVTRDAINLILSYKTNEEARIALGVSYSFLCRVLHSKTAVTEKLAEKAGWVRHDVWKKKNKTSSKNIEDILRWYATTARRMSESNPDGQAGRIKALNEMKKDAGWKAFSVLDEE